jgi:ankyrin repeat protein
MAGPTNTLGSLLVTPCLAPSQGCVKELILNGADYNAVDEFGRTSMYLAAQNGFNACILAHLDNAVGRDILR